MIPAEQRLPEQERTVEDEIRLAQSNLGLAYDDLTPATRQRIFNARKHLSTALKAVAANPSEAGE